MKGYRSQWEIPDVHRESAEYVAAGARIELGQAVYDRRTALGLSQAKVASRAGITRTVIARLEGGSVTLTMPLMRRLADGLQSRLNLTITGNDARAKFLPIDEMNTDALAAYIDAAIDLA
jgi:transcriptional regulator with XRE-family HTH domain